MTLKDTNKQKLPEKLDNDVIVALGAGQMDGRLAVAVNHVQLGAGRNQQLHNLQVTWNNMAINTWNNLQVTWNNMAINNSTISR